MFVCKDMVNVVKQHLTRELSVLWSIFQSSYCGTVIISPGKESPRSNAGRRMCNVAKCGLFSNALVLRTEEYQLGKLRPVSTQKKKALWIPRNVP